MHERSASSDSEEVVYIDLFDSHDKPLLAEGAQRCHSPTKEAKLAHGSHGTVFKAIYANRPVAVKTAHTDNTRALYHEAVIYQEIRHQASNCNDFIAELINIFEIHSTIEIAFKLYADGTLRDTLQHQNNISHDQRLEWMFQFANCVAFLHNIDLVHADLKTDNVLLTADKELRIADFDCAHFLKDKPSSFGGALAYRSPKLLESTRKYLIRKSQHHPAPTHGLPKPTSEDDAYSSAYVLYEIGTSTIPLCHILATTNIDTVIDYIQTQNIRPDVKPITEYNPNAAQLITRLWQHDQTQRPTMIQATLALIDENLVKIKVL